MDKARLAVVRRRLRHLSRDDPRAAALRDMDMGRAVLDQVRGGLTQPHHQDAAPLIARGLCREMVLAGCRGRCPARGPRA